MKQTLLAMTQDILSGLSSDEVNSISDTTESMQVANIIKQKYFDIINRVPLTEHEQLIQLDPSLSGSQPVLMYIPNGIADLQWLKYYNTNVLDGVSSSTVHGVNTDITPSWSTTSSTSNTIALGSHTFTVTAGLSAVFGQAVLCTSGANSMTGTVLSYSGTTLVVTITSVIGGGTFASWVIAQNTSGNTIPGYQYVTILSTQQFIDMVNSFNPSESNVSSFTLTDSSNSYPGNYTFYYRDDRQPKYCTVISNYYVVFDSFDNTQDSTLQSAKSMGWGRVIPAWSNTDTFVPNLAEEQFQLLFNEAKALAFFELKQTPHQLAMQETKRGWSNVQKNKSVTNKPTYFEEIPNFGRSGGWGAPSSYFKSRGFDRP